MDLYIDYENLKSFLQFRQKDSFDDCMRMLKRQIHIIYNMEKSMMEKDPVLKLWGLKLGTGRGNSEETDTYSSLLFPDRPIKSNSYNTWDRKQISSVFLIDDQDTNKLQDKGCILVGKVGEELSVLEKLFCSEDYSFHRLYNLQRDFNSWEQLEDDNQMLPCTDIIINDRYLFRNEFELVKYNLTQMLSVLLKNVRNKTNIVVFTHNTSFIGFGCNDAKDVIKSIVKKVTGINPKLTFVTSNNNNLIPHDRFIIMNYRLIRSGDSFLYFNTKGETITNGGSIDIDSLAYHDTYLFVESLFDKLQNSYHEIFRVNKDMIIGDKESRFIHFIQEISDSKNESFE